jgi:hypothetical protein
MSSTAATPTAASGAAPAPLTEQTFPAKAEHLQRRGIVIGGGALAVGLIFALVSPAAFFPAYLAVYLFFLGLGLGSLGFLMINHLTGGLWGFTIRRPLEAASMTLPLMALLFLPILLGLKTLYPWTDASYVEAHEAVAAKSGYLNLNFWLVRAVLFHLFWSGLALLMRSNSMKQDQTDDPSPTRLNQAISAPGLLLLFLTVTFAMTDWAMSTEPEWYSTIYPVMIFTGMGLSGLALAVATASRLRGVRPLSDLCGPEVFNDLGSLLLAFVMLWAYMSFSQYLIIWMGNLAEEVPWYIERSYGGWRAVAGALMVFHFFVPFFFLLVRDNKRDPARLARVALWVVALQFVNDVWLIVPGFPGPHWAILLALVPAALGVGGLWVAWYAWLLKSRPLVPLHDPMLAEALARHNHGGGGH